MSKKSKKQKNREKVVETLNDVKNGAVNAVSELKDIAEEGGEKVSNIADQKK